METLKRGEPTRLSDANEFFSHAAALPVNASPLESPQHVAPSRISRPFCVFIPESAPHTGQYTAAAVNAPVPSGAMVAQRLSTLRWI